MIDDRSSPREIASLSHQSVSCCLFLTDERIIEQERGQPSHIFASGPKLKKGEYLLADVAG